MDLWSLDDDKLSVTLHQRAPHTAKVTATAVTFYMCPPIAAVTFLCSYTSGLVFLRRGLCPVAQEPPCQPPVSYEAHNLGIKKASLKPSF